MSYNNIDYTNNNVNYHLIKLYRVQSWHRKCRNFVNNEIIVLNKIIKNK